MFRTDSVDTSGKTRLKVFGGLYGTYLGIGIPIALNAESVAPFSMGLMFGPGVGIASAAGYAGGHSVSAGDAIALSSLTWFGAMQGHLWASAGDVDDGNAEVGFGVLGSALGFVAGLSSTGARDYSEGHAAALGAGNWWGTALGFLAANANEDATGPAKSRGAAIGGASGLTIGAIAGHGVTHNEIRYLHIGGALGWLYASGIVVLQEPGPTGENVTQMIGIGTGMTAALLAAKYRPWRPRPELHLDHSGRMRAQVFAAAYGGYLATVIPLAGGVEWWEEDTKRTYALSYMHAPPVLFLGTTFLTRNVDVPKANVLALSGLTWFGAMQGAMWASADASTRSQDVALASALGSAGGLALGAVAARRGPTEAQGAMIGAGNWWGSALGLLWGNVIKGEDGEGEDVAASVAVGEIAGVALAPVLGARMSLDQVRTMHVGGLAGWLFGAGSLLGGGSVGFRAANGMMGTSTLVGLVIGASVGGGTNFDMGNRIRPRPFATRCAGLSGEQHTVIGFTVEH